MKPPPIKRHVTLRQPTTSPMNDRKAQKVKRFNLWSRAPFVRRFYKDFGIDSTSWTNPSGGSCWSEDITPHPLDLVSESLKREPKEGEGQEVLSKARGPSPCEWWRSQSCRPTCEGTNFQQNPEDLARVVATYNDGCWTSCLSGPCIKCIPSTGPPVSDLGGY
jgi:hypothetical protein